MGTATFKTDARLGAFTFQVNDPNSAFTGGICGAACTLTGFDWQDLFDYQWHSTGVGDGGVSAFNLIVDAAGVIHAFSFSLVTLHLPGTTPQDSLHTMSLSNEGATQKLMDFTEETVCRRPNPRAREVCTSSVSQVTTHRNAKISEFQSNIVDLSPVNELGQLEEPERPLPLGTPKILRTVPEPASLVLTGLGLLVLAGARRKVR